MNINPTHLLYVILLSVSLVLFLNKHHGKEILFRVFYCFSRTTPAEYLRNKASARFAKLWSCYFCQGAHVAHTLSWAYGWWVGLSLGETCYLVLITTPVAAAASELIIGFFDDVQQLTAGGDRNIGLGNKVTPEEVKKITTTPADKPVPTQGGAQAGAPAQAAVTSLESYVAERKKRGYDMDIVEGPNGQQSVLVRHVPERERLWESFYAGKPPTEVPGVAEKWEELAAKWEDVECTRCEKNVILSEAREEILDLIDAYLSQSTQSNEHDNTANA